MYNIIKSVLGKDNRECSEVLNICISEENAKLLDKEEIAMLSYLANSYALSGLFPTEDLFKEEFGRYMPAINAAKELNTHDLKVYLAEFLDRRRKQFAAREFMRMSAEVGKEGVTDEHFELVRDLYKETTDYEEVNIHNFDDLKKIYEERANKPLGLKTYVREIDDKIGGLDPGTVNIIFGWTGSFKTTWALNIAYSNAVKNHYNIAYISLEVPKLDIMFNIISRHSFEPKFDKYPFIPHDKIRKNLLSEEQKNYAFDVVWEDFLNSEGRLTILDETDFKTFGFAEIRVRLEELDDKMLAETGYGLDAVVWDHANLFKFSGAGERNKSQGDIINDYISFIRKLSIAFRKDKKTGKFSQLCNIVVAQCNREGWKKADKVKGRYELTAISEANEIERAGYRIMSVYTNDDMKHTKEARVQLLKNRSGETIYEPIMMFVDPEAYVAGGEIGGFSGGSVGIDDFADMLSSGLSGIL